MTVTDEQRQSIMAEIAACLPRPLQPYEFTIGQYAKANNLSYAQAKTFIVGLLDEGKLMRRDLHAKAHAYWRPEDAPA